MTLDFLGCLGFIVALAAGVSAAEPFLADFTKSIPDGLPVIEPWRTIPLDPAYAGQWVILEDVDGDGQVEVISARNVNVGDVHYTSAVVVHRLDGSVLWRWGGKDLGRSALHHDVACQVHDWDGDGKPEVVICAEGELIALAGADGSVLRRCPLPPEATDCLVFANLTGGPRPTDVLVKTRYGQIWAFDRDWKQLWTVQNPGGYKTAHQPYPLDINGDGRDEVMAGFALLNPDGFLRWTVVCNKIKLSGGHLDCCRPLARGSRPEDWRLVLTACGANGLIMTDGNGRTLWEVPGHHFESLDIGKIRADVDGLQIVVDDGHHPAGRGPIYLHDERGNLLGTWLVPYARFHTIVDWNGDGLMEVLLPDPRLICDGTGKALAKLDVPDEGMRLVRTGDFTGDGVADIAISTPTTVYIFRNPSPPGSSKPAALGSGLNATLY
jgi:hypothetical protein